VTGSAPERPPQPRSRWLTVGIISCVIGLLLIVGTLAEYGWRAGGGELGISQMIGFGWAGLFLLVSLFCCAAGILRHRRAPARGALVLCLLLAAGALTFTSFRLCGM
jgi:hypothetical protein